MVKNKDEKALSISKNMPKQDSETTNGEDEKTTNLEKDSKEKVDAIKANRKINRTEIHRVISGSGSDSDSGSGSSSFLVPINYDREARKAQVRKEQTSNQGKTPKRRNRRKKKAPTW